ncbi:uncharacterized protein ACRADG_002353 [Cochliomyia hominivorax]
MLKFILILLVVVMVVQAFDFTDLDYDQFLINEFESLNEDFEFSRHKRDAYEAFPGLKDKYCCKGDKPEMDYIIDIPYIKRDCAIKYQMNKTDLKEFNIFDCEQMSKVKQVIISRVNCLARTLNMIDENDQLNREAIVKRFAGILEGQSEWKLAAFEGYIDKCMAKVEALPKTNDQYSTAAMELHRCFRNELLNGCPADLRIDSSRCNRLRETHRDEATNYISRRFINAIIRRSQIHCFNQVEEFESD